MTNTESEAQRPSELLQVHRDEVLALIELRGGQNPRVFGSIARGTDSVDSDIDIIVKVHPQRAWDFISLPRELSQLLGRQVDVVSEGGLKDKHRAILEEAVPL